MHRFLINSLNGILLILIFIGVPAITEAQVGTLQVTAASKTRLLTFWGLGLAAAGNTILALGGIKDQKARSLCAKWVLAFTGLLGIETAYVHGYLSFTWLKETLLWLQKHF